MQLVLRGKWLWLVRLLHSGFPRSANSHSSIRPLTSCTSYVIYYFGWMIIRGNDRSRECPFGLWSNRASIVFGQRPIRENSFRVNDFRADGFGQSSKNRKMSRQAATSWTFSWSCFDYTYLRGWSSRGRWRALPARYELSIGISRTQRYRTHTTSTKGGISNFGSLREGLPTYKRMGLHRGLCLKISPRKTGKAPKNRRIDFQNRI